MMCIKFFYLSRRMRYCIDFRGGPFLFLHPVEPFLRTSLESAGLCGPSAGFWSFWTCKPALSVSVLKKGSINNLVVCVNFFTPDFTTVACKESCEKSAQECQFEKKKHVASSSFFVPRLKKSLHNPTMNTYHLLLF